MVHDLGQVFGVQRVQDVEHVLTRRALAFGELVREVGVEDRVVLEGGEDVLHAQLVVVWDFDRGHRCLLEELLLADQEVLEEVLVHHGLIGQVILQAVETKLD